MTDLKSLLADAAQAAAEADDVPEEHAAAARQHVWDRHYAEPAARALLAEKLATSTPEFQAAVAATERALAEELAEDNARRARVRAQNPTYFKDYK